MTESLPQPSPLEVESRKINSLVEQYKEKLGPFDVVPVGEVGFVVQPKRQLPMARNDWFMFDYDDTLRATAEVNREDTGKLDDPFHFRAPDKKLILQSKIPWSKDIEEIFM